MLLFAIEPADAVTAYTTAFDSEGGSMVDAQSVTAGGIATKPADPIRSGYPFAGWYTDDAYHTAYDFSSPVTGNFVLYAKWTAESTGESGGGTTTPPETYTVHFAAKDVTISDVIRP